MMFSTTELGVRNITAGQGPEIPSPGPVTAWTRPAQAKQAVWYRIMGIYWSLPGCEVGNDCSLTPTQRSLAGQAPKRETVREVLIVTYNQEAAQFYTHAFFCRSLLLAVRWRCLNEGFGFLSKHFRLVGISGLGIGWHKPGRVSVISTGSRTADPRTPSRLRSAPSVPRVQSRAVPAAPRHHRARHRAPLGSHRCRADAAFGRCGHSAFVCHPKATASPPPHLPQHHPSTAVTFFLLSSAPRREAPEGRAPRRYLRRVADPTFWRRRPLAERRWSRTPPTPDPAPRAGRSRRGPPTPPRAPRPAAVRGRAAARWAARSRGRRCRRRPGGAAAAAGAAGGGRPWRGWCPGAARRPASRPSGSGAAPARSGWPARPAGSRSPVPAPAGGGWGRGCGPAAAGSRQPGPAGGSPAPARTVSSSAGSAAPPPPPSACCRPRRSAACGPAPLLRRNSRSAPRPRPIPAGPPPADLPAPARGTSPLAPTPPAGLRPPLSPVAAV